MTLKVNLKKNPYYHHERQNDVEVLLIVYTLLGLFQTKFIFLGTVISCVKLKG